MSVASEKKLLTNSEVIKIIGITIVASAAWFRMEYKFDQVSDGIIKRIDSHILSDGFEKQAMGKEISELKQAVQAMQDEAKDYFKNEFVRPDEPKIETKKHR